MQSFVCMLTFCCQSVNIFKRFLINLEISTLNVNEENANFYVAYAKKSYLLLYFLF